MMTHKERFHATIAYEPVDKPASWLGLPVPEAAANLKRYFGVHDMRSVLNRLDDDLAPVELPFRSPTSQAIYMAFDFAKGTAGAADQRTLTAPGFFEDYTDPDRVADFDWPDPARHIDPQACRRVVAQAPRDRAVLGVIWSAHFQDACAAFGMETALIKMVTEPQMFQAVIDRIVAFYLQANGIFYEATRGQLDAVLIGNDFGSQQTLMVSPALLRRSVFDGTRQLIEQAHHYGLKVIHHACGAIAPILPDLIALGADVIHPLQALAKDMSVEAMQDAYFGKVAFCGGIDAQHLIVHGTPQQVFERVQQVKTLFPTGLVISPSHEAILPDVNPANIEAMFQAIQG